MTRDPFNVDPPFSDEELRDPELRAEIDRIESLNDARRRDFARRRLDAWIWTENNRQRVARLAREHQWRRRRGLAVAWLVGASVGFVLGWFVLGPLFFRPLSDALLHLFAR